MGFLNPLFLVAAGVIAVPIFLHFFYRQESKTLQFPAIRYLLRTEKDHARQIRTQQLLLLLLRIAILLLVVLLGARVHFPGPGGAHEPTALALVLDNSMSTTLIEDGERRLERLKAVARESALGAGHDDEIWVIGVGTPWETATPGSGTDALAEIDATTGSHAAGDLGAALRRAFALVGQSDLPAREVHVFTDLQASGLPSSPVGDEAISVVFFALDEAPIRNRGIRDVVIGGGLPPLANRRTEAVVETYGSGEADTVGVRLYIDGEVRAATRAPSGATVRLPVGPFPTGTVEGFAEVDPDPLTADDRFYFTLTVRDPTEVASLGEAPFFVDEALSVLQDDGRITLGGVGRARTVLSAGGAGLASRDRTQAVVVYPVADAARLPALNRALAEAGIPYRYESPSSPQARVTESTLAVSLDDLEISTHFRLVLQEGDGGAAMASLSNGEPWIVAGQSALGPYVLLASPLDEQSTTLPVSAAMIPLLEWAIDHWSVGQPADGLVAGLPYAPPPTTTHVEPPGLEPVSVDGDQPFPGTREAGIYQALRGDTVVERVAANAPAAEGDLTRMTDAQLRRIVPGLAAVTEDEGAWSRNIFRAGRGPEPWRPLLVLLLVLLAVEAVVAASGRRARSPQTPTPQPTRG